MGTIKEYIDREEANMRWYDVEPDVYMAISMIECSYPDAQTDYANYIIRNIKIKDTDMNYIRNIAEKNVKVKYQRWYDKNETLSTAIEYLKNTTSDLQKEISLGVLEYKNEREAVA